MSIALQRMLLLGALFLVYFQGGFVHAQGTLKNDLILHWSMDTVEDGLVPDLVGTNHLKSHNLASTNLVPGKFGKALSFDGVSQFLSLEKQHHRILPIYARQEFTISMWVRGAPRQLNRIVFAEGARDNIYPLFLMGTHRDGESGQLNVFVRETGVILNNIPTDGVAFNNNWTHIVWVNLGNSAKVFINGEQNTEYRYERPNLQLDYLSIGALYRDPPVYFFKGEIDEVAVWERILKPKEIKDLMENGLGETTKATIGN